MSRGKVHPETVSSQQPDKTETAQEGSRLIFGIHQESLGRKKKRNNLALEESNSHSDSYNEIVDGIHDMNRGDTKRQLLQKPEKDESKRIHNRRTMKESEPCHEEDNSLVSRDEFKRVATLQNGNNFKNQREFKSQLLLPNAGKNSKSKDSNDDPEEVLSKIEPPPTLKAAEENSKESDNNSEMEDGHIEFKAKSRPPKKKCFWRQLDQGKIKWDLFIMLLATINCFQVPYSVAFTDIDNSYIWLDFLNIMIDFTFVLDVVISFRTSVIIESTAQEIYDNKKIAMNYLKGRFWIDFPASIPFDLFTYIFSGLRSNQLALQMIGLLKLVRILRLSRLITYLNVKSELKMSLKLVKLIFFLILFLHCLACIWFFIVKQNEEWMPPLDYVWVETGLYNSGSFHQYLNALYHAILMLGGNDVGPRGNFQLIFVCVTLLTGAIINANIFGNMAVILQSLNKKATNFQEKLDNANETMKNLRIPRLLQEEIKDYFTFTQNTQDHQSELKIFMSTLSPSLRQKVISSIFKSVLDKNPIFNQHSAVINQILGTMETCLFLPENKIITQNQEGDMMYFIAHGQCDVTVLTEKQKEVHVSTINEGDFFGEVALIKKCKRTASVISKNYTTLASFHENDFDSLIEEYPFIKQKMERKMIDEYTDPWKKFVKKVLRNIDYLSYCVSDETIEEIVYLCEPITVSENTQLFRAGSNCNDIYIISDGQLEVSVHNSNTETILDTLHIGSSIGAYCSLVNEVYSISGKSKTTLKLLKLPIKKLFAMREQVEDLDYTMMEYERYVDENGLPYCDYRIYRHGHLKLKPMEKFRIGIRRIMNIIRSYKSLDLRGLLEKVRTELKKKKADEENRRKSALLRGNPMKPEQKAEEYYYSLKNEMKHVQTCVANQNQEMNNFQSKMIKQMQNIQRLIKGESELIESSNSEESKHGSAFNNVSTDPRRHRIGRGKNRHPTGLVHLDHPNVRKSCIGVLPKLGSRKSVAPMIPANFQDPISMPKKFKAEEKRAKMKKKSKSYKEDVVRGHPNLAEREETKEELNSHKKNKIVVLNVEDEEKDKIKYLSKDSSLEKDQSRGEMTEIPLAMRKRSTLIETPDSMIHSENKLFHNSMKMESSGLKHRKFGNKLRKNQKSFEKGSATRLDIPKSNL
ncbi:unnamed protein product [Moneuplotes crassus]|uniref:Cyclic nucleotide-binding domain-containing protein n=1 Tax=Euplotes crassus TaxID=5936 RepID=A0AAD1ULG1_EUPCR|nr:unnamed protein product [Moneuplotes crassus]